MKINNFLVDAHIFQSHQCNTVTKRSEYFNFTEDACGTKSSLILFYLFYIVLFPWEVQ